MNFTKNFFVIMLSVFLPLHIQATEKHNGIDKHTLIHEIRSDLYMVFVYEMGIISMPWKSMAQGNDDLEQDLKNLYSSFNKTPEETQKQLDEFCKKWQLPDIKIEDISSYGPLG